MQDLLKSISKKSQITFFIIFVLVLLISFFLIIFVKWSEVEYREMEDINLLFSSEEAFLKNCLEEKSAEMVLRFGKRGGDLIYDSHKLTKGYYEYIPIYYSNNQSFLLNKDEFAKNLEHDLELEVGSCEDDLENFSKDVILEKDFIEAEVNFYEEIDINYDLNLKIIKNGHEKVVDKLKVKVPVDFSKTYDSSKKIISMLKNDSDSIDFTYLSNLPLVVSYAPSSRDYGLFSLTDNSAGLDEPFIFVFSIYLGFDEVEDTIDYGSEADSTSASSEGNINDFLIYEGNYSLDEFE